MEMRSTPLSRWAILSAMSTALGLLVACALGIALSFTAYVAVSTLCARLDTLTRWAATAVALAGLCTAIFHLLAWEHAFTQVPVLVLALVVSTFATIRSGGFAAVSAGLRRDRRFARRFAACARRSPYRWILLAPLPAVARAILLPPLGWDALTYHSVKAAMWVQHGGGEVMKGPGPWAYYANMPAGAEVLQAWTMLPTSSDVFTTSLDVLEWIAVGLGVILLARRIGAKEPLPSIAAAFVLSIPPVRLMLGSAYSEPFLLSMLLIGLALLLSADRSSGALVAGGLALGLSASAKVSVLPATSVALLLALGRWTMQGRDKRVALAALLAYAMPIVPWFVVNAVTTGLPLSPFDVRIGHLALGASPPEYRWYIDRGIATTFNWQAELRILKQAFAWPEKVVDAPGVLCLLPFVGMLPGFARLGRRSAFAATLLASVIVACLGFYFSHQFAPIRHTFPQNSGRFLLPAIMVATVATTAAVRPHSKSALVPYALLAVCAAWYYVDFALVGFSATSKWAAAEVVAGAALLLVLGLVTNRLANATVKLTARLALVGLALFGLTSARDNLRSQLFHSDYTLHWFAGWRYWVDAADIMDVPTQHLRVAVLGGAEQNEDNWFVYPFMGRRLQNEVVYVPPTGTGRQQNYDGGQLWTNLVESSNYWAWRMRLGKQHISHVMSFRPASIELGWMDAHPESFERLAGAPGDWGLFAVRELSSTADD
jgi:hypothetical protein